MMERKVHWNNETDDKIPPAHVNYQFILQSFCKFRAAQNQIRILKVERKTWYQERDVQTQRGVCYVIRVCALDVLAVRGGYTFFLHLQQVKQSVCAYIIVPTLPFPVHSVRPSLPFPTVQNHTHL